MINIGLKTAEIPSKHQKGNTLVMVLALIVTFSTIAITLSDLISVQSQQVEFLLSRGKVRYITHSGLLHMEQELREDVSQTLSSALEFKFETEYCVAWISQNGIPVCDANALPTRPCCRFQGSICVEPNTQGRCKVPEFWVTKYKAVYDSTSKSIAATGCIGFLDIRNSSKGECNNPETECFDVAEKAKRQCPSFLDSQRLNLAWE